MPPRYKHKQIYDNKGIWPGFGNWYVKWFQPNVGLITVFVCFWLPREPYIHFLSPCSALFPSQFPVSQASVFCFISCRKFSWINKGTFFCLEYSVLLRIWIIIQPSACDVKLQWVYKYGTYGPALRTLSQLFNSISFGCPKVKPFWLP